MPVKTENINDLIEISDSDDENDNAVSAVHETGTQNDKRVDLNGSTVLVEDSDGDDFSTDQSNNESTLKVERNDRIKIEMMDECLPLTSFDPNQSNDTSDIVIGGIASTSMDGQRSNMPQICSPTNGQKKMKRNAGKRFKCKQCKHTTNRKGHMKRHQQTHDRENSMGVKRNSDDGMYQCTLCIQKFKQLSGLCSHMKKVHKNNRYLYNCTQCMRRFVEEVDKDTHEMQCEERLYECFLCKRYNTRKESDLQIHMRTHSGIKPFRCEVCGKSFRIKSDLRRHLNTVHSRTRH